jgi:Mn2+/Fe2+ NRAMP family transporter
LLQVFVPYRRYAPFLKFLTFVLFAYVATALTVKVPWGQAMLEAVWPRPTINVDYLLMVVAVLGTTISPYLFFWQASQEVEHEKAMGRRMLVQRQGASSREIVDRKLDVGTGTFFSNLVMYFIILTAAVTLHTHGVTKIETSKQAAEALRPLAGSLAYFLYTAGLIGVGLLAVPTLTGSAAYAFAETFKWKEGLDKSFKGARAFYTVLIFSTLVGIAMDFLNINPVKALYWTAIINGVLAPFLLVGVLYVACDRKLMQRQPSSWLSRVMVGLTAALMFIAAGAMFFL